MKGWIGVDLDGTLAHYEKWVGPEHIGEPIPEMVERVRGWMAEGKEVRIFTSRVWPGDGIWPGENTKRRNDAWLARSAIWHWCYTHLGRALPVTHEKDPYMVELWDDRARRVETNTGRVL